MIFPMIWAFHLFQSGAARDGALPTRPRGRNVAKTGFAYHEAQKTASFAHRSAFTQSSGNIGAPPSGKSRLDLAIMQSRATGSETTHARDSPRPSGDLSQIRRRLGWDFKF
jgi:hypothetical protein